MANIPEVEACSTTSNTSNSPLKELGYLSSHVAASAVELGELQWSLLVADAKAAFRQSVRSMLTLMIASIASLAGIPVIALGIAYGLHEWLGWPLWLSHMSIGITFIVLGAIAAMIAAYHAASSFHHFHRSADEFAANIRWLKNILRGTTGS